jgi:hypothetical protein
VACGTACCAGNGCCGDACQVVHSNGLGQSYYDCGSLGTFTLDTARLAAGAWAPTGGTDSGQVFSGDCLSRSTASACATWCYTGTFAGRVRLNSISISCQSPDSTSPFWN